MRYLFVTNDFPPKRGGIESYLMALCAGMHPDDVVVIAPARAGHEAVDEQLPYTVVRVGGTILRASSKVRDRVQEVVRELEVDVVVFLQTVPLGRMASRVRRATGKPVVIMTHGSGDLLVPARFPLARRMVRRTLVSADLVTAASAFTAQAVEELTKGRATVRVVWPPVDHRRFSLAVSGASVRAHHGLGASFGVLFVGRLVKRKGADILIRALAKLPDAKALIVGAGPEEQTLRRLADQEQVADRIVFCGSVSDDRLPEYYAAADVFCMPCTDRYGGLDTEGFGIVYTEASASGLPCVAGRCGGSSEAVVDGVTGIVLEDSSVQSVGEALRALQRDETRRTTLGANGRARVERELTPKAIARRFAGHVQQAIGR